MLVTPTLNPRVVNKVDTSFDKNNVAAGTEDKAFKFANRNIHIIQNLEIKAFPIDENRTDYRLVNGEKEVTSVDFQKIVTEIEDSFLESSKTSSKLVEIAINKNIPPAYSNVAKQALNSVMKQPRVGDNDDLLAVLVNGYQNSSHNHQVSTAFDLIDKLNLRTLSLNEALDDFRQKMSAYGKVSESFIEYGESLITTVLDRRANTENHFLEGKSLDSILEANETLAKKARKSYAAILTQAAKETSVDLTKQNTGVTNYAQRFEQILIDLVSYPETSTEYKNAVSNFHNTVQSFSEDQTLSAMKKEALEQKLKIIKTSNPSKNSAMENLQNRFQTKLNTEYNLLKDRNENFTDALIHVREILDKVEGISTLDRNNPSAGLSSSIMHSLLAEIDPKNADTSKAINPDSLEALLSGDKFTQKAEAMQTTYENFYRTEIENEIRTTRLLPKTTTNAAIFDINNVTAMVSLRNALGLPMYKNNQAAQDLLNTLNHPQTDDSSKQLAIYDFFLSERQQNINSLFPVIDLGGGNVYNLREKTVADIEVLRDEFRLEISLVNQSSEINLEHVTQRYGENLSKNLSESIAMVSHSAEQEASTQPIVNKCKKTADAYKSKFNTSYQSGKDFFINFIERLLKNIEDIFNVDYKGKKYGYA